MQAERERGIVRSEWPRPSVAYMVGSVWWFAAIWAAVAAVSFALGGTGEVSIPVLVVLFIYFMRFAVTYDLSLDEVRVRNGFAERAVALGPGVTLTHRRKATPKQMLTWNQTFRRYDRLIEVRDAKGRTLVLSPTKEFAEELEAAARSRGVTVSRG